MRIVVLVKYVPDITGELTFEQGRLVRAPGAGTLNELDEHAIEAALRIIEDSGSGEVIALTMAPETGDLALRKAFQFGAERGIRITDVELVGADVFTTTTTLAAAIRLLAPDLVVTGMVSTDGGGAVLPALLADALGWAKLTFATKVKVTGDRVRISRETDEAVEAHSAALPVVLSVTDSANTARQVNFKLIMAARTKPVEVWSLADLGLDQSVSEAHLAPRVVVEEAAKAAPRPPARLVTDTGTGGEQLAEYLIDVLASTTAAATGETR